jgi:hypothetical protein
MVEYKNIHKMPLAIGWRRIKVGESIFENQLNEHTQDTVERFLTKGCLEVVSGSEATAPVEVQVEALASVEEPTPVVVEEEVEAPASVVVVEEEVEAPAPVVVVEEEEVEEKKTRKRRAKAEVEAE